MDYLEKMVIKILYAILALKSPTVKIYKIGNSIYKNFWLGFLQIISDYAIFHIADESKRLYVHKNRIYFKKISIIFFVESEIRYKRI